MLFLVVIVVVVVFITVWPDCRSCHFFTHSHVSNPATTDIGKFLINVCLFYLCLDRLCVNLIL